MTFHIGAKPGDIAETVLLPGDPYRARWAAQKYLENPVLVNEVRGMLGYTGTWHGHRVTIPSLQVKVGDVIEVRERNRQSPFIQEAQQVIARRGCPAWSKACPAASATRSCRISIPI